MPPCFDRLDMHAIPHIGILARLCPGHPPRLYDHVRGFQISVGEERGRSGSPSPAPVSVKRPKDLGFRTSITIRSQLRVAAMKRLDHTGWAQVSAHLDTSLPDDLEAAWGYPEPRW